MTAGPRPARWLGRRSTRRPSRRRRWLRWLAAAVAVACLAGLPVAGGAAVRGWQVGQHLAMAAELARELQQELVARQPAQARQTLAALQEQTRAARQASSDPGWRLGSRLPGVGANFAALATVAVALDDLAWHGLPPLVEAAAVLDPAVLAPRDGRIALAPLQAAAPRIRAADQALRVARDRVAGIATGPLAPPLRAAVSQLRQELARSATATSTAARAAELVPPMLGAAGPRTYLVMFQNPAEIRATGGMPGAYAVLRADQGRLAIVAQGTAGRDLQAFEEPVLPLDRRMRDLYTDRLGTYPANVNLTPHFPTAAQLYREMYRRRHGETVDGVIATDPVALSYLLRATGPIQPASGPPLTASTAVRVLLAEVYETAASNLEQDAYFAAAAAAAFEALLDQRGEPAAVAAELARAAGERRTLVWSAHPAEQAVLAGTVLGGELPTQDGSAPVVGVFLNDGTGAKLGYYLTQAATVTVVEQRADGRFVLRLRMTLGSTVPPAGLPESVLGMGLAGEPYTIRTNVSIFSPTAGGLMAVRLDGAAVPIGSGLERNRMVGVLTVDLPPGVTRSVDATLLTDDLPIGAAVTPQLWVTPAATAWEQISN